MLCLRRSALVPPLAEGQNKPPFLGAFQGKSWAVRAWTTACANKMWSGVR